MSQIDDFLNDGPQPQGGSQTARKPDAVAKPKSQVDAFLADAPAPDRGLGGFARDAAAWAVKGAIAVPEAIVGLADIPTGGRVGKALENEGGTFGFRPKQAREIVNEWHSDATKEAQRKFQEAEGLGGKFQAAIENPSNIAGAVIESLPAMGAGGVIGRGALAATRLGQMGSKGAVVAGALGEGAVMAGSQAEGIRQETDDGLLTPGQAGAALATGAIGAGLGYAGGKLANKLGVGNAETMLAQGTKGLAKQHADEAVAAAANPLAAQAAKSIPRQVIEGALVEGVFEELPQSMTETIIQNLALDKPWNEGLDDAIVMGILSGGAMGAGAAGYKGFTAPKADENKTNEAKQAADKAKQEQEARKAEALKRVQDAWLQQAQILAEQEAGEPEVPQTAPPDAAAMLAQQRAQEAQARQAEIDAGRAMASPDDEIYESTGTTMRPSEAMGLNPTAGGLEGAAALAVDTGASAAMQAAAQYIDPDDMPDAGADAPLSAASAVANTAPEDPFAGYERDYDELSDLEKELYDWEMTQREAPDEAFAALAELNDSDIPFFDRASNATDEDFLRALGASDEEIADALTTANQSASTQSHAASTAETQTNEPRGPRQSAGQGQEAEQVIQQQLPTDPAARIAELEAIAKDADAQARDWASRTYKHNPKPLPEHEAKGGPADVGEANEQRRLKAIADAKQRAAEARAEITRLQEQGNTQAQLAAKAPSVADLAAISRKQIPDMTDAELVALASATSPEHGRFKKLQKALQSRGLQAQAATNKGATENGTQASQTQQAGTQQQQARTAAGQAVDGVPAGAAAQAAGQAAGTSTVTATQKTGNDGAQAAAQGEAVAKAIAQEGNARREAERQRKLEASERWTRMTAAERQAAAANAKGLNAIQKKNVHTKPWADLSDKVRAALLDVVVPQDAAQKVAPNSGQQTDYKEKEAKNEAQKAQGATNSVAATAAPSTANLMQAAKASRSAQEVEGSPDDWRGTLMKTRVHARSLIDKGRLDQKAAQAAWQDHVQLLAVIDGAVQQTPPTNSTAPEHQQVGVDDRELAEIVDEFNAAQERMVEDDERIHHLFDAPAKDEVVRLQDKVKVYHAEHGWMTPAEAKARIEQWKAHAKAQGKTNQNANKVVLSLFDLSGEWSKPWEEAGYQVYRFDIQDDPNVGDVNNFSTEFFKDWFGDFEGQDIYAILAACPCTDFAVSGARHFAAKDADGRTVASVRLVHQTLATIEHFKPAVWAIENPVGRIEKLGGLPPWRLSFDPNHLGDPYTKKTLIWGRFNGDLPIAPVEPTEGSKMHRLYGGKSLATKNARSVTPEGFAYGFFMANNAIDHPVMAVANKYDRLDRDVVAQAVKAGLTPSEIDALVEDHYYMDLDDKAAEQALRDAIAEKNGNADPVRATAESIADKQLKAANDRYTRLKGDKKASVLAKNAAEKRLGTMRQKVNEVPALAAKAAAGDEKAVTELTEAGFDEVADWAQGLAHQEPVKKNEIKKNSSLGKNRNGFPLFEDANGVRYYVESGIRIQETVSMRPTAQGMQMTRGELKPDWMTEAEYAQHKAEPAAEAATDVEQQRAIERHGLPDGTTFSSGKGMASGKWIARAGDTQGNMEATIDEAASSLAQFLQLEKRRKENTAAMVALSKKVADKLKRGEQPTDVELRDLFGLDPRHAYVKQSAVGQFLVDYMGVSRNKIRASLGAAAGDVTSDGGVKYPVVYPRKLHQVFGTTEAADEAQAGDKQAKPAEYGANNKLVSKSRADELRAKLREKAKNHLFGGLDTEMLAWGTELAVFHLEAGVRKFADFAVAIANDLGTTPDKLRPYLRSWYNGARDMMEDHGLSVDGMDSPEQVRAELQKLATEPQTKETENAGTAVHGSGTAPLGAVAAGNDQGNARTGDAEPRSADGQQARSEAGGRPDGAGDAAARSGGNGTSAGNSVSARKSRRSVKKAKGAPKAATLQEQAAEEIKEASPVNIPGIDFTITDEVKLGQGTEAVKYADNIAAIRTLKQIEQEQRRATPEEQRILARYVGWGGLKNAFRVAGAREGEGVAKGWEKRVEELESLLTPAELRAARNSTTAAHYTSETVVKALWKGVQRLGFRGGAVLEPSVGTGNFLGLMPQELRGTSKTLAVEYDSLTARIAQHLYPNQTILHSGFQDVPLPDGKFALAIGNPPFGRESLFFRHNPALNGKSIHNQFFIQSLQSLQDDGIMGMVVSHNLMDAQDQASRLSMAISAEFVGAIRLPDTAFKENARTEVVTDILFFRKRSAVDLHHAAKAVELMRSPVAKHDKILEGLSPNEVERAKEIYAEMQRWVPSSKQENFAGSGETISVNPYFLNNPQMVIGRMDASGTMNGRRELNVVLEDTSAFATMLDKAVQQLPERAPVDAVAQRTLAQFDQLATAMRLAVNRAEPGAVRRTLDGQLKVVLEMDDPEGNGRKTLLTEFDLNAETPWEEGYTLRSDGKWQREDDKLGEDGKPIKQLKKDGTPSNLNVKEITVYDDLAQIPEKHKWGAARIAVITDLLPLRDGLKRQLTLEASDAPEAMIEANRKRLNDLYKAFKKKHGELHKSGTVKIAMTMPDGALALALEQLDKNGKAHPADILQRRVTVPPKPIDRVKSAGEAVAVVLAERGHIDLERVAQLLGTDEKGAMDALSEGDNPRAFYDPETGTWEPADAYLSGLVRRKLLAAKAAGLEKNVAALEKVQPEDWDATQITPNIGSAWIPGGVYADFLKHLGFSKASVYYSAATNTFTVAADGKPKAEWSGSDRALPTASIVERLMNSRPIKVQYKDSDGKTVVDEEATLESQMKAAEISNEFLDWAFADDDRREQLVQIFNEKYNTRVVRQRDGSHLTLPGKVPDSVIKMRPWQLNAVWRGITDNAVLYDHAVGAGKTFTAIARIMERRRMGLSKKPMVVVPNHLVEQWAADARKLYPGANILAATKHDFDKQRRRRLFARIGSGDYDMVIVGHSSFNFIDIDPSTEERYLDEELRIAYEAVQVAEAVAAAAAAEAGFSGWGKPMGVAEAERLVKKLEERMAKVRSAKRDRLLTFEEMGIDDLTVDEAHEFKNLAYSSRLQGVSGMGNKTGSAKAMDLNLKIRSLRERPGTSVAFLTGTPVSNSVAEMYLVLRNLAHQELKEMGMENFDAWRTQYVSASSAYEPTESGSLKEVTRLGREWMNMKSLMDLYYSVADAVTLQDMKDEFARVNPGKSFPVPKVRSQVNGEGDRAMVAVKPSKEQQTILRQIVSGFEGLQFIKNRKERGAERLRLMDRARKVSLDARAVDPSIHVEPGTGKIGAVVDNVFKTYQKWDEDKGTQIIFLDRSVPKSKGDDKILAAYDKLVNDLQKATNDGDEEEVANIEEKLEKYDANEMEELRNAQNGGWNAYEEIKRQLVAKGIPANEIRFVQEANNDAQKAALFKQVNSGEVRVLIGSTPRMGAGTNVQERLVALHHVDVTWKPSDIEQREGRIVRQGNHLLEKYGEDFTVDVIAYATEMTVDAKMWSLNATKLKAINGIRKYDGSFSMEFEDEESASMAEMAALATGNPLMVERVQLDGEIKKLEMAERSFTRRLNGVRGQLRQAERTIEQGPAHAQRLRAFAQQMENMLAGVRKRSDARRVTVNGQEFTSAAEAELAAMESVEKQQAESATGKGRYVVEINGEKATSRDRIQQLIRENLGDKDFEAEVDGQKYVDIGHAVRAIMDKHGPASSRGREFTLDGITINGMKVELDIAPSRWRPNTDSVMTMHILDGDGRPMVSRDYQYESVTLTGNSMRAGLQVLLKQFAPELHLGDAAAQERQVERAKRDLPELQEQAKKTSPYAEELAKKRDRLQEVVAQLRVSSDSARLSDAEQSAEAGEAPANFAADPARRPGSAQDKAVMQAIADGKSARDVLRLIANGSKDPFLRQVARLLLKAGITPNIQFGHIGKSKKGDPIHGQYRGSSDTILMAASAEYAAERIFMHEAMHAATMRALKKGGLARVQLQKLLEHVRKQGGAAGFYGLTNVYEFVAEVFTNPDFQNALRTMRAPAGSPLKSAWHSFVQVLRRILGLGDNSPSVLSQALELGVAAVRQDMVLRRQGARASGSANAGTDAIDQTQTEAFKRWFGDSKVVDKNGKPLVVYHGTPATFTAFDLSRASQGMDGKGFYFTSEREMAEEYSEGGNVIEAYISLQNPANEEQVAEAQDLYDDDSDAIRQHLIERGFDGVMYQDVDGLQIVAFRPEQIKSATGNNGNFDPEDPSILNFGTDDLGRIKASALDQIHKTLSHPGKVSLWDKTVGTMRHIAERYPAFKPVFDAAQQFLDDVASVANEAADMAPRLIPRVDTMRDMLKKPISVADNRAIGKALFSGTLDWGRDQHGKAMPMNELRAKYANLSVDTKSEILMASGKVQPQVIAMWRGKELAQYETLINNKFESTILKSGVRFSHEELRKFFNLNEQQISLYDEARATVDKSLDLTARAEMLRKLGRDWDFMRDMVMDAPTLTEAWKLLHEELEQRAKEIPDSRDQMAAKMFEIRSSFDKAQELMEHGYMPLQRFGKYTVDVVDENGERVYFSMFESKAESNKMAQAMRREYPNARVVQGTMNDQQFKLFAGITPETAELFGSMLGLDADGQDAKDQAFQEYLKLAKNNHSALKRLIHRKGIAGYSEDVGRVLASFVYSNARLAATGLNAGKMEQAINTLQTEHKEQGELGEIAAKLRSYIQDPQEEGHVIRGMLFAQYLGGSVASAAVNMTQPFAVTLPWLTQYGGMAAAGRYLAGALRDMAKRGHKYEADLAHALKMAEDDGVVSPQEIHQLMAQARGAGGLRTGDGTKLGDARAQAANLWEKVKVGWGQPFALAEQFNRRSTFIAAYRLAKDRKLGNPAEFARRAVLETQFLYSKANKPQWARGAVGGTLFTFKTYSVSFLELMHRMWTQGGPEGKRAVGWAMAMLLLMGGAGGLPFMEDLEDLIDGAGQMMGYNVSAKQWRQQLLRDVLGAELAGFIEQGMSGLPGAPVDVSGRLGMGNLIPGTGLLLDKQSNARDVVELLGPAGDLVQRGMQAVKSVASGVVNADPTSIGRGVMEVMPTAVRNAAKGVDMAASGIYKDTKGYKVIDTTLDEAVAKFLGFQPRSVAEVQEANSFMQRAKSFYIQTSNEIKAQWAKALFEKDAAGVERARQRVKEWNEKNPDQPIRVNMRDIWERVRQMGKDRTARIADTAPKAVRQQLRSMAQDLNQ